jgi:hypothetical protein
MRVARVLAVFATVTLVGVACSDDNPTGIPAGLEVFTATLNGANERPDPTVTGATGTAVVTVMDTLLSWRVDVTNIQNVFIGHIHMAVPDSAGGVWLDLTPTPGDYPTTSTIALGSIQGDTVLALASIMRNGRAYVNIHTTDGAGAPDPVGPAGDYPGGEIRGQLRKQ